jgi:hypothetical protein
MAGKSWLFHAIQHFPNSRIAHSQSLRYCKSICFSDFFLQLLHRWPLNFSLAEFWNAF